MAEITVESGQITFLKAFFADSGVTTVYFRRYLLKTFFDSDGVARIGSKRDSGDFFEGNEACTVDADGIVAYPSFTLASTTDGAPVNSSYTFALYDAEGARYAIVARGQKVPPVPASTTLADIFLFNQTNPVELPDTYYTALQINALLAGIAGGGGSFMDPSTDLYVGANGLPTLSAALTAAGTSVPTRIVLKINQSVAATVTIPANVFLTKEGNAKLSKAGSGAIAFAGVGLDDPLSTVPLFSGFAPGDITWAGAKYPNKLSAELFDTANDSLTQRVALANAAFSSTKSVQIICSPRTIDGTVTMKANTGIHFLRGSFGNTYALGNGAPPFIFRDDFSMSAEKGAIINLSNNPAAGNSTLLRPETYNLAYKNIYIDDLYIVGNGGGEDGASATIIVGNAQNGHVRNCFLSDTRSYGITVGGNGDDGNYAENFVVEGCTIDKADSQVLNVLNGKGIDLRNNRILVRNQPIIANCALMDIEPHNGNNLVWDLTIEGNVFDVSGATYLPQPPDGAGNITYGGTLATGIALQATETRGIKRVSIINNKFIGKFFPAGIHSGEYDWFTFKEAIAGYGVDELHISGNKVSKAAKGISITQSRNLTVENNTLFDTGLPMELIAIGDSEFQNNVAKRSGTIAPTSLNINESERIYLASAIGGVLSIAVDFAPSGKSYENYVGQKMTLNGLDYTVASFNNVFSLTLSPAPVDTQTKTFPASAVRVSPVTPVNTIAITSHGYNNGAFVQYVAGSSAVGGLANGSFYYVIKVDNNTIKFAASLDAARSGTAINLTSQGTGTHTINPLLVTKFSNNKYINNTADITLAPTGTSRIYGYKKILDDYANYAALPAVGEQGRLYVTLNDNQTYRWTGSTYVPVGGGGTGGGTPAYIYGGTY